MTFSALDSALTGPLFATEAMRAVFADRARLAAMLRTEAALARAEAKYRLAANGLAAAIEKVGPDDLDLAGLGRATADRRCSDDPLRQGGPGKAAGEAPTRFPSRHHHAGYPRHRPCPANGGGVPPRRRRPAGDSRRPGAARNPIPDDTLRRPHLWPARSAHNVRLRRRYLARRHCRRGDRAARPTPADAGGLAWRPGRHPLRARRQGRTRHQVARRRTWPGSARGAVACAPRPHGRDRDVARHADRRPGEDGRGRRPAVVHRNRRGGGAAHARPWRLDRPAAQAEPRLGHRDPRRPGRCQGPCRHAPRFDGRRIPASGRGVACRMARSAGTLRPRLRRLARSPQSRWRPDRRRRRVCAATSTSPAAC